jgi:hypothetical protein
MKIIGIDPAPKKETTLYDRSSGWWEVEASALPDKLRQLRDSGPNLLCWDAPLTIGKGQRGCYYERDIETFFRNHKNFTTPKGISVRPFAGCPHWAITHASLGLPYTGKWATELADLPYSFIGTGDRPSGAENHFVVEVHPAVALWLWCRAEIPNGPWRYKKRKVDRLRLWEVFSNIMPQRLPEKAPKNDDQIDSFIACLLGELWMEKQGVILLGSSDSGSFLVPDRESIESEFSQFCQAGQ